MTPDRFIETRSPDWNRLEVLNQKAGKKGVRALEEKELHELSRLYPTVAVDVARAKLYRTDSKTLQKINSIAIASHGLLYRRKRSGDLKSIKDFLLFGYPQVFREHWRYLLLSLLILIIGFTGAYNATRLKPSNAYLFVPGNLDLTDRSSKISEKDISERFRQMEKPPMAAGIITNNISVALQSFALGITAGIGTCYILLYNSLMLGGFAAHFVNHELTMQFCTFILPHGILEIFAILVSAAAGLKLGLSFAIPGNLKRFDALRVASRESVLLVLGTIPMFIVAGLIESFITPTELPGNTKISIGIFTWTFFMVYFLTSVKKRRIE